MAAITLFVVTAPRGRRWLARGLALLLGLSILPLAAATLFPEEAAAGESAALGNRFFVLASLFQTIVLIALVSAWGRLVRPPSTILLDVLRWLAAVAAAAIILREAGVEPGTLFAGSAVVTAAVGFALRDTLGNVFSGLVIQAERPFEVGDWIQYDANPAHVGGVIEINWRATRVTTPYDVSPQRVQGIILEAIRGSFGVLEQPAPSVVTNAFTDRGVEHWVRLFTTEFDKRDRVDGTARDRIWFALARHGIEIPVATRPRLAGRPSPPGSRSSARTPRARACS